jgi:DNA polymerase I
MTVAVLHETTLPRGGKGTAYDLTTRVLRWAGIEDYEFIYLGKQGQKFTKQADWMPFHNDVQAGILEEYEKVLCLGGVPMAGCLGTQRGVSIQKRRGRGYAIPPTGQYMVGTYSPHTVWKDWDFFRDFSTDIYKLATHSHVLRQPDDYSHDYTLGNLDLVYDLLDSEVVLATDIETLGFNFYKNGDELLSLGFAALSPDNAGVGTILSADQVRKNQWIFEMMEEREAPLVFHNMKFDVQHLSNFFGRELLLYGHAADTMLMHYALDERPSNRYKVHGLKMLARVHFDAPDYEIPMGPWIEAFLETDMAYRYEKLKDLYWYQFQDCWYTRRLHDALEKEMVERGEERDDLHRFLDNHLYPATLALGEIERHGVPVDKKHLEGMHTRITAALVGELETLQGQVLEITKGEMQEFNPNSPVQVKKVVYDHAGCEAPDNRGVGRYAYKNRGKKTTDKDVLKVLASIAKQEGRELVAMCLNSILTYRQRSKVLGTYVTGMLERCVENGDKGWATIYANFFTAGTATGRLSCANPNLQNIPDASHVGEDVRSAFAAPPGYVLLEADYSQLELRVAGLFSGDRALLEVFREGRDIHQEVAYNLWQKPKDQVTKYERYLAKCLNFGLVYGRGPRSIATGPEMDMLESMRGARWSAKEVEVYYKKFLAGFPRLVKWMEEQKQFVHENKYVDTPFGNRRRFYLIPDGEWHRVERQAVNSPIQGFASLLCMDALTRIHCRLRDEGIDARILFTVHDSITILCNEDQEIVRQVIDIVFYEMEQHLPPLPGVDWDMLPFKAEVEVKRTWGGGEDSAFADVVHAASAA